MSSELRFRTYRLSGIPPGTSNDVIRAWFPAQEQATIKSITQAQSLSGFDDKKDERLRVATITFSEPPPSLDVVQPLPSTFDLVKLVSPLDAKFSAVQIDAHFLGMTPLSDPAGGGDAVDIVAVTGLGGRPYGSWQCVSDGSMWLQDALPGPRAIPEARVMIYGYASKTRSDSHANLDDFTDGFLRALETSRLLPHENCRPLILVGHSLGGLIVKNAFNICASEETNSLRALYCAISGLVFFGTPHKGMQSQELMDASRDQPTQLLIQDLRPGATKIRELGEKFMEAELSRRVRVISCAELRPTPTLVKVSKQEFKREGPRKIMVRQESAYLDFGAAIETKIPIDANHSQIAKLSSMGGDVSDYENVKKHMRDLVSQGLEQVPKRFQRLEIKTSVVRSHELLRFVIGELRTRGAVTRDIEGLLNQLEDIRHILSDKSRSDLFFGEDASPPFLKQFGSKSAGLEDTLHPFEHMAIERSLRYQEYRGDRESTALQRMMPLSERGSSVLFDKVFVASVTDRAGRMIQGLMQMLSISMLRRPEEVEHVDQGENSRHRSTALSRVAMMQAMVRSPNTGRLPPLQGDLKALTSEAPQAHGLQMYDYHPTDMAYEHPTRVLVEYKQYARRTSPQERRSVLSEEERQQERQTCDLAQKLAALLQGVSQAHSITDLDEEKQQQLGYSSAFEATTYALPCLGYMEQSDKGRVALLFAIPSLYIGAELSTLRHLIETQGKAGRLPLEQRAQLAFQVCTTMLNLHCSGWLHKSIRSDNVLLFPRPLSEDDVRQRRAAGSALTRYDMYLIGFELSREVVGRSNPFESIGEHDLYRHPDRQGLPSRQFTKEHDLYAVGLLLLEIGEGKTLQTLLQRTVKSRDPEERMRELNLEPEECKDRFVKIAQRALPVSMGSRYARAVVRCLKGTFEVETDDKFDTHLALAFQRLVVDEVAMGIGL